MDDIIQCLEGRINALVKQCEQLKQANTLLRQSKVQLVREKEVLLAKQKATIVQIETMVSRLKSLEKS
jgi:uncharacterized protein (TIGR02449 family)